MNTAQKIFTIGYITLIIVGLSGAISLATGVEFRILLLVVALTIAVLFGAIGITLLGVWIYGWLEQFTKGETNRE